MPFAMVGSVQQAFPFAAALHGVSDLVVDILHLPHNRQCLHFVC